MKNSNINHLGKSFTSFLTKITFPTLNNCSKMILAMFLCSFCGPAASLKLTGLHHHSIFSEKKRKVNCENICLNIAAGFTLQDSG